MARIKQVTTTEMRELVTKLQKMNSRMLESLDSLEKNANGSVAVSIDGWPSAFKGAALLRTQFVKIVGEGNLVDVQFNDDQAKENLANAIENDRSESSKKSSRNKKKQS